MRFSLRGAAKRAEERLRDAVVVVAQHIAFVDEVARDGFHAECADAVEVGLDRALALARVLVQQRCGEIGAVLISCVVEDGSR